MKLVLNAMLLISSLGFWLSCASTMAKIIPIGEPVTKERCEGLNLRKFGFDDGFSGRRTGERFEFWQKDCAQLSVHLDRQVYQQGYEEGISQYCSCENGFAAGVKEEFTEFKGQYLMCQGEKYRGFLAGHQKGLAQATNQSLAKKINHLKIEYNEPAIATLAKTSCSPVSQESYR